MSQVLKGIEEVAGTEGEAALAVSQELSPADALVAKIAEAERERQETIKRLCGERVQVLEDAQKEHARLTAQLKALGWKAARAPRGAKTDNADAVSQAGK